MHSDADAQKTAAALAALGELSSNTLIGLGSGSTAQIFVRLLGERISSGSLDGIRAVCTSSVTEKLARECGVNVLPFGSTTSVAITVDGADEVDPQFRLIKGLGAALLREKIIEQASERFIVVVDESKLVDVLGSRCPLPVEVVRFAARSLELRWRAEGFDVRPRENASGLLITDEGHEILDVRTTNGFSIEQLDAFVRNYAGVVETGYFAREATDVFVATSSAVRRLSRIQ